MSPPWASWWPLRPCTLLLHVIPSFLSFPRNTPHHSIAHATRYSARCSWCSPPSLTGAPACALPLPVGLFARPHAPEALSCALAMHRRGRHDAHRMALYGHGAWHAVPKVIVCGGVARVHWLSYFRLDHNGVFPGNELTSDAITLQYDFEFAYVRDHCARA